MRVRDLAEEIGIHAVTVHALRAEAASFHEAHGFVPLRDDPMHLVLQVATIQWL